MALCADAAKHYDRPDENPWDSLRSSSNHIYLLPLVTAYIAYWKPREVDWDDPGSHILRHAWSQQYHKAANQIR